MTLDPRKESVFFDPLEPWESPESRARGYAWRGGAEQHLDRAPRVVTSADAAEGADVLRQLVAVASQHAAQGLLTRHLLQRLGALEREVAELRSWREVHEQRVTADVRAEQEFEAEFAQLVGDAQDDVPALPPDYDLDVLLDDWP